MRLLACTLGLAASACSFRGAPGGTGDAPTGDGPPSDAPLIDSEIQPDVPADPKCFGSTSLTYLCLQNLPQQALTFDGSDSHGDASGSLDTTAGSADPLCAQLRAGSPSVCVIAATSITIDRFVGTYGGRPIVFLATEGTVSITSNGGIDASSGQFGDLGENGPGTNTGGCALSAAPGASGGGAGGSLGALGGIGGASGTGNTGGSPASTATLTELRGGCPGGSGRGPSNGVTGLGGLGGGSVTLVSAVEIVVDGWINASGGGGEASTIDGAGAGGGGSGGVIILDTPSLTVAGKLLAEGGGGGGGSGTVLADGGEGATATETVSPAMGGSGGGAGGRGGDGSSGGPGAPGSPGTATAGGGGGGGGAGIIRTMDPTPPGGSISPPFS